MLRLAFASTLLLLTSLPGYAAEHGTVTDLEIGQRIYRDGILPDGQPVQALGAGGSILSGKAVACMTCHRRSGFGSAEGRRQVPAITGKILYEQRTHAYREIQGGRHRGEGARPAYTDSSLAQAITQGIDNVGRRLDPLMPRFSFTDSELALVIKYLKNLETLHAPGITDTQIHLATVFTPDTSDDQKIAVRTTLTALFRQINAESRHEDRRAKYGPWSEHWDYGSYRHFEVHFWELSGPSSQWGEQLNKYYAQQPVYALVNGIGTETWQPVHDFCETNQIPCLFPSTELPGKSADHFYSLYFSTGVELEARAAAQYLAKQTTAEHVLQLSRNDAKGYRAVTSFTHAWQTAVPHTVIEHRLTTNVNLDLEALTQLLTTRHVDTIIAWLPEEDLSPLVTLLDTTPSVQRLMLSNSYVKTTPNAFTPSLGAKTYLLSQFIPESKRAKHLVRYLSWAKTNHAETNNTLASANAFYAGMMTVNATRNLRANLVREHLIEELEPMMDNGLYFSVYPNFTLGPNQKFASKGCFVIGPMYPPSNEKNAVLKTEWIVP
ncbi:MAG: ABC transporter substrate-binding protein [Gammaproteobacteria bacterium]|nr:ABC transporter substrate-binding protein [Gammaproteobacteria bacterium]